MANITRIKNNQITDKTITYAKIADNTLTGGQFNQNLTLNSNVTILGNLTIANSFAQLNSINTYINDPLVVFNNNYIGSPTYDIGILVNRNLSSLAPYGAVNAAFVWKESDAAFEALMTTETGTTAGSINNSGWANVKVGNLTALTATISGALSAGTASFASINGTPIGNATPAIGSFTYLTAVNGFQTANAVINGGYISTLTNATITTASLTNTTATNFYSGNIYVSGGYINNLANIAAGTGYITNLNSTNGNVTTLQVNNFNSANAVISGGYISAVANIGATYGTFTNLASGNAQITGGSLTGITNLSSTTSVATNFSSGNAVITGGSITGDSSGSFTTLQGTNFSSGNAAITGAQTYIGTGAQLIANAYVGTGYFTNLSASNLSIATENVTTLSATNFSSGNAVISGGYISAVANIGAVYGTFTNLGTANAVITGGSITGLTTLTATTAQATNFSSGNAVISGGYISAVANIGAVYGTFTNLATGNAVITGGSTTGMTSGTYTTLQASNFSSPNAVVTGGSVNNSPIGNATPSTAAFTTLTASGATTITGTTESTSTGTGAVIVSGGVGIAKNLNIGGNAIIAGNLTVNGTFEYINATVTTHEDPILELNTGVNGAALTGTSFDAGIRTHYFDGTADRSAFFGRTNDSQNFEYYGYVSSETGNVITGTYGTIKSGALLLANTTAATSSATGALQVSGGAGIGGDLYAYRINATYGNITTGYFGSLNTANAVVTGGYLTGLSNVTTTYDTVTNLYTANAVIAGGYITGVANVGTTYLTTTNLYTANAVIAGGYATGLANATATYGTFTNLNSGNVLITGGSTTGMTGGTYTTLQATNFSSGNAQITGGSLTGITIEGVTTLQATNFSSGNVAITGGYASGLANATATYGTFTNLNSGNVLVTGGSITGLTSLTATTAQASNFSSGNAVITGGSINNTVIGNTTPAAATFTQLNTTGVSYLGGNIVANSNTASTSTTTGAIVIPGTGGIGIGGNINAGVFNTSLHHIQGNVLLGQGSAQDSADSILTINMNTDKPLVSNATVHISGTSGKTTILGIDSFGTSVSSTIGLRRARGTSGAPSAVQKTDVLGAFNARGYGATGYQYPTTSPASGLNIIADENFTDTAMGTYVTLTAVPDGATTGIVTLIAAGNGQVRVPATTTSVTANDGAFIVGGGAGITGNVNIGGKLLVADTSLFQDTAKFAANVVANSSVDSQGISSGALVVVGGVGIYSNVNIGGASVFNANFAAGFDTITRGATDATLIWARPNASYDQVIIGGSATASTVVRGAKLQINSTDSILLPVGTNAQRPSNSGGTDTQGMLRYNSTINGMEIYTGTSWQSFSTSFTVIADAQYNGDGTTTAFTLGSAQTTASCIVSINGVVQIPTLAYSVTGGTTLTFTEAPAAGDVIDVRMLTTTATVTSIASINGYMSFVADNTGANITTGTGSATVTTSFEPNGAQVSYIANVSVASASTPTTIDSFDSTKYRSAKYVVQVTNGSNYQVSEVLVIHDGTTATRAMYSTINTNANVGVTSATFSGGNVVLQYIAASSGAVVRIKKDYVAI